MKRAIYNCDRLDCEDRRYRKLNERYKKISGHNIPLLMIPRSETFAGMDESIRRCEEAGKNLFAEIYNWQKDVLY